MSFHDLRGFLARLHLRLKGMARGGRAFQQTRLEALTPPCIGARNVYWHGESGMSLPGA